MKTIIDDYLEYYETANKEYAKVTVLMEVGQFFELYGVNNNKESIGNVSEITALLNIRMSRKNKNITENSRKNPLMAGFPSPALSKYLHVLLENDYTVVLVEQTTDPPDPERKLTKIYSPGTCIDTNFNTDSNNLVCIYIEGEQCHKTHKSLVCIGVVSFDFTTGKGQVYEIIDTDGTDHTLNELYRIIYSLTPREIIIYTKNFDTEINIDIGVVHTYTDIDKEIYKISYQDSLLSKVYPNTGLLSPIEYIGLENKPYASIALILLLKFAYKHNEKNILYLEIPSIYHSLDKLILYNNAATQLDIINKGNCSLFTIINKCSTAFGKRKLKEYLLNPITNVSELEKRYNLVNLFIKNKLFDKLSVYLKDIIDIPRLHRKQSVGLLHPSEFSILDDSYSSISSLIDLLKNSKLDNIFTKEMINKFKEYITEYTQLFDLTEISKYSLNNITSSFYKKGIHTEIDDIQDKIDDINNFYTKIGKKLSGIIETDSKVIKLDKNDQEGYYFIGTKKRCEFIKKELKKGLKIDKEYIKLEYKNQKNSTKIFSKEIRDYSDQLVVQTEKIKKVISSKYQDDLYNLWNKYKSVLEYITEIVGYIDVIKSFAKTSFEYNYTCPQIIKKDKSFIDAKSIRHPIIERLDTKTEYITNDTSLGLFDQTGMLLYGLNGSGKSSYMKSVGLNVILAQIGMFVAADKFNYSPFRNLFTRITGQDNLFKGQSTFVVEMTELRAIIDYSDKFSLVLGDEITKGTEYISGTAIMTSSVVHLSKLDTNFVFATHLHGLSDMDEIKKLSNVSSYHLKVDYTENNDIIYNRKLEPGHGESLYGIEVMKYIINNKDFVNTAFDIRNQIIKKGELQEKQKSVYNSKVYTDHCEICSDKSNLHTHHIKFQCTADTDGFINKGIHKNDQSNLVVLCNKHHDQVHHGNLIINGWILTSNGRTLDYKLDLKEKKKKYTDKQINIIRELKGNTQKKTKRILKEKHDIIVSLVIISKVWKDTY
jgi:DNA mismatch repair protein MutS